MKFKSNNLIDIRYLLLIKPILDIFWQVSIFNYFLMLYIILIFIYEYRDFKITVKLLDIFIITGLILIFISFFREVNNTTFILLIKMVSPFILYYIGVKLCNISVEEIIKYMLYGYLLAFFVDIISLVTKTGFIYWGNSLTFVGYYFFKTDLGVSLIWLIFLIFLSEKWIFNRKIISLSIISLSYFMIILSNSRMTLILSIILPFLAYLYHKEKSTKNYFKIDILFIFYTIIIIFAGVYALKFLGESDFFQKNGFISFNFDNIFDLYSGSNLQGRNEIWDYILDIFNSESYNKKILGVGLNTSLYSNYLLTGLSAHNLYIGILYSTGYLGISIFVFYLFYLIKVINRETNRKKFYLCIFSLLIFLVYGISVDTHIFTNFTWNFALISGVCLNLRKKK